jgi:hypothetical protein
MGKRANVLLLDEELCERLVALQLDQLTFSIDGGTARTFESIRVGASFATVLQNIGLPLGVSVRLGTGSVFQRGVGATARRAGRYLSQYS